MRHTLPLQRPHLDAAARAGLLQPAQVGPLWDYLLTQAGAAPVADDRPRFSFTHVLYYLGGMLALGAMSVFMTLGWSSFGGWGVFFIALLYIGVAWKLAQRFEAQGLPIPMGIMATLIVVLVPLATWAAQQALGFWPSGGAQSYRAYHAIIDWRWLTLELATLAAGAGLLYRWRAPFMLMPIAVTLWYMSMDLAVMIVAADGAPWSHSAWTFRKWFSVAFGASMILFALLVDLRNRSSLDFAFWLYLFGLLTFWGGLTSLGSAQLAGKLVYLAINVALVLVGAVLLRRTFPVFGAVGVFIVLSDLSWRFFRDSWLFPIALTLIGLGVVYLGIWWSRHEARLAGALRSVLPLQLQELLARRAFAG